MNGKVGILATAIALLPLVAHAQATREGNEYDFKDHQPTAAVQSQERSAGVAPSQSTIQNENRSLDAINNQLLKRAQNDARAVPSSTNNVYGVQPGGVIQVTPNAGTNGVGGSGSGASR